MLLWCCWLFLLSCVAAEVAVVFGCFCNTNMLSINLSILLYYLNYIKIYKYVKCYLLFDSNKLTSSEIIFFDHSFLNKKTAVKLHLFIIFTIHGI
jgi:hypothetical protein